MHSLLREDRLRLGIKKQTHLFCSPLGLHYLCTCYEKTEYFGDEPHECGGIQAGGETAFGGGA